MKVAKLQGTPWHYEQRKRSCDDKSTNCIYNRNICSFTASYYYHKKCVGKGVCEDFESKGNSAKIPKPHNHKNNLNIERIEKMNNNNNQKTNKPETPNEKFKRLSKSRINNIEQDIKKLSNLSNRSNYSYSQDEVKIMFDYLQKVLDEAKGQFAEKPTDNGFTWE